VEVLSSLRKTSDSTSKTDLSVNAQTRTIQRTFATLTFLTTLSTSLIWGVNTLFLLDAGLNNLQAFSANAFYTAGQVLFEIPTGIVADAWGRRTSYLLGALTLLLATLVYVLLWYLHAPFWMWAIVSVVLGLGFTFFSGATEAWLVDAMAYSKYEGEMDPVFAKGQIAAGIAMLSGSVGGGVIAQMTNLGMPYVVRAIFLILTFAIACKYMKDLGFTPVPLKHPWQETKFVFRESITYGLKIRPVRWLMLIRPFTVGIGVYAFYALQPYLLKIYGDPSAYSIAGLAAALIAGAQIIGGLTVPYAHKIFSKRTSIILSDVVLSIIFLFLLGFAVNIYMAIIFVAIWAFASAFSEPVYLSLMNKLIPSKQRATILSFNGLMGSSGGVVFQPILGKAADIFGYAVTYIISSVVTSFALIFVFLARKECIKADRISNKT
jgi:MFS family permease